MFDFINLCEIECKGIKGWLCAVDVVYAIPCDVEYAILET